MSNELINFFEPKGNPIEKGELAENLFPPDRYTVDCAVPQQYLMMLNERGFKLQASEFCMVYPKDGGTGFVAPLTRRALTAVSILATYI